MEEKLKLNKSKITSFKNRSYKNKLPLEIEIEPQKRTLEQSKEYICVNDNYYSFDYHNPKYDIKHGIGVILFSLLLHFGVGGTLTKGPFIITIIIILFGVAFILKALLIKNQKLVLDRIQGLFSYPNYWSNNPVIIYFNEAIFLNLSKGKMAAPTLVAPYSNWRINGCTLALINVHRQLSLFVWYMDKNRPLPPGTAFDPYRQKDFERRKSEGFPPPLYYSNGVITPEATPEQQAEREKYWKDRDYFAPPIKRPENSEIFNTRTHQNWSKCNFENGEHKLANTWYEFTFNDGKIVYMLTNENGVGYLPPENLNYKTASLTIKGGWF